MSAVRAVIAGLAGQENINFLLTNRIPRRLATTVFGWFSRIEQPLVRDASIAVWKLFADLDLSDAEKTRFASLHDCFIRRLKDGARPIDSDPDTLVSPCDAIVGACGTVENGVVLQIKGFPYPIRDLFGESAQADTYRNGSYVTLRLTSSMYHRFHAPHDCQVEQVTYISGDTWNVNPIALRRVERLFCRNERAPIRIRLLRTGHRVSLVPVAAILVAGIRLGFLDTPTVLRSGGPRTMACAADLAKGEEMGWFEHGSTIVVFAPPGFALAPGVRDGAMIRVGRPLLQLPSGSPLDQADASGC